MPRSLRLAVLAAALALVGALVFGVVEAVAGPDLGAHETELALAAHGKGRPESYQCERLWLDYWDYRCRWEEPAVGWIVIDVRVDRDGVVERSVD
ncbi:MAG TPA: hypothetical protein VFN93_06815 [Gaiellaceae bacterium]|nr:hypothetical protein [Gaiellaceae bacterium]